MATLEEERYLRNLLLFGEGGIFLLRHLVVHEDRKSRITLEAQLLRNRNLFSNILKEQYQILYPSPLTANVDLNTWDLSILLLVVKKLFSQGLPHPVVADIGALKAYRNSLQGHPNSMSLTASDYKSNRQRVKNILRSIASYVHQTVPIEDLITRTKSDSIDIRSVIRQVKETQAFSNSIQSILDDKLQQINQNLASMGTDLKSTKDKVDAIEKNQKEGHEEIKKSLATLKDSVDSSKQNQEESHNELKERLQFIQECSGDSQLTLDKVLEELRRLRRDVRKNQSSQVQKAKHDFTKELDTIIQAECENEKKQKEATDLLFDFVQIIQSNKKYDDGEIKLLIAQRVEWYGEKLTLELINDMIKWFSDVYDHCDGTGDARIGSIHLPIFCSSVKGLLTLLCYINSNQCKQHLSSISSTVSKIFVSSCSLSWKVDSTSLQSAMTSFLDNIGPESSTKNLKKLILPFYATDIKQLTNIWKLFGEENRSIHLENISRTLSKIFEETILLRTSVDKNQLLEAVKQTESSELAKEECEGIKRKLSNIEILVFEQKEEIKRLRLEDSDEQKQQAYEKAKLEWRNKMIKEYHKTVLKVPAMPLLPDETCECRSYSHIIYDMSQLAYETLFKRTKDESLAFDIDVFDYLHISDETRERCLKLGILTENKCPSLCVSEPPGSIFSFIHKLVQEFLAAVNIAINFEIKMKSSAREDIEDTCTKFVKGVLQNCSTVNEVLEQSNVVIMLCGLEPRLAAHVSKYIYDIVKEDPMVQIYRRTIDSDFSYSDYPCIREIQTLIVDSINECNSCPVESNVDSINECNSCPVKSKYSFCIGDLYIYDSSVHGPIFLDYKENCDIVCSSIDQQQIIPDFIHSIFVNNINTKNFRFSEYLPNFEHLEKIIIYTDPQGSSSTEDVEDPWIDKVNKSVVKTIETNVLSLKSLSLNLLYSTDIVTSLYKEVVCFLPRMINLVAIKMTDVTTSHDDTTRLCEYIEGTSQLEQIHIDIKCECRNQHDVDLSEHKQLQYLDLSDRTCICVTDIDTENLQIFKFWKIKSTNYIKIFDCFKKCDKLKELELCVDYNNESQSFHTSITKRLVSVLLLLHNLSKLNLHRFRLTDNIIQVPSEMKSLKSIDLRIVTMSLTTWRNFVDSLPNIPHTVDVELCFCHITRDDEEFKVDKLSFVVGERVVEGVAVGGEKGNEARQYVKDRKHLFIVRHDDVSWFTFSTRK